MALKTINLGVAFLLELAMLAAFAYWGLQTDASLPLRVVLGIGVPLLAALIWARFMAPKSARRLTGTRYLLLKFILFGLAAIALAVAGQSTLAVVFVVVAVINQLLLVVWKQETPEMNVG
jgi:hypothetical protein